MNGARPGWEVGDALEEDGPCAVSRLQLIEYAGASGDYNPIHTIDEEARKAGLPGVIAHGMLTAAMVGRLFSPHLQHGYVKELAVRFSEPVYVGDELCLSGRVTAVENTKKGRSYAFEVQATKTTGERVASGTAVFDEHGTARQPRERTAGGDQREA